MFSNGNLKTPQLFIIHYSFFIFHFTPSAYGGRGRGMAVNDRRYGWDGRGMAGRLPALQAGADGVWPADCRRYRRVRSPGRPLKDLLRCGGRRPLRREGPVFVIARPVRRLVVAIRLPRPLFPMFSNGNLKTPQLFIFHSSFFISPQARTAGAGGVWRSMTAATGRYGRGMAGRLPALQAGAGPGASRTPPPTAEQCLVSVISSAARNPYPRPLIPDP